MKDLNTYIELLKEERPSIQEMIQIIKAVLGVENVAIQLSAVSNNIVTIAPAPKPTPAPIVTSNVPTKEAKVPVKSETSSDRVDLSKYDLTNPLEITDLKELPSYTSADPKSPKAVRYKNAIYARIGALIDYAHTNNINMPTTRSAIQHMKIRTIRTTRSVNFDLHEALYYCINDIEARYNNKKLRNRVYSVPEVAKLFGVSPQSARQICRRSSITAIKSIVEHYPGKRGGSNYYDKNAIDQLLRQRQNTSNKRINESDCIVQPPPKPKPEPPADDKWQEMSYIYEPAVKVPLSFQITDPDNIPSLIIYNERTWVRQEMAIDYTWKNFRLKPSRLMIEASKVLHRLAISIPSSGDNKKIVYINVADLKFNSPIPDHMLRVEDIAKKWGLSVAYMSTWLKNNNIANYRYPKDSGHIRYDINQAARIRKNDEIDAFANDGHCPSGPRKMVFS